MDLLVAAASGAGFVLLCESEYACLRLFKRRTTLFFYACQLAILSSALLSAWNILLYYEQNLRLLSTLVISVIIRCIHDMSYPIMILLRLRFIHNFPLIIMYIPVILAIIVSPLRYFNIRWLLTGEEYYLHILFIIMPIITVLLTVEYIIINIFFIVVAIKHFENIVHIRHVVIINIIVIILECAGGEILLLFVDGWGWAILCILSIVIQIEVRLEIDILSYIARSVDSARERQTPGVDETETETEINNFCNVVNILLWRSRAAGL
jgi:hypothetical protein